MTRGPAGRCDDEPRPPGAPLVREPAEVREPAGAGLRAERFELQKRAALDAHAAPDGQEHQPVHRLVAADEPARHVAEAAAAGTRRRDADAHEAASVGVMPSVSRSPRRTTVRSADFPMRSDPSARCRSVRVASVAPSNPTMMSLGRTPDFAAGPRGTTSRTRIPEEALRPRERARLCPIGVGGPPMPRSARRTRPCWMRTLATMRAVAAGIAKAMP